MKLITAITLTTLLAATSVNANTVTQKLDSIQDMISESTSSANDKAMSEDILMILEKAQIKIKRRLRDQSIDGDIKIAQIAKKSCQYLSDFQAKQSCYTSMMENVEHELLKVVSIACSTSSYSQHAAECYTTGISVALRSINDEVRRKKDVIEAKRDFGITLESPELGNAMADVIFSTCKNLGYYSVFGSAGTYESFESRNKCFKGALEASDKLGEDIAKYTKGCFTITNDVDATKCFVNSLEAL